MLFADASVKMGDFHKEVEDCLTIVQNGLKVQK